MIRKHARFMALQDIVAILGIATYSGRPGITPAFEANKLLSDQDKKQIRREWDYIVAGLDQRMERAFERSN